MANIKVEKLGRRELEKIDIFSRPIWQLGLCCILLSILIMSFDAANGYGWRPTPFSLTAASEHRDRFPEPAVEFTVSWEVPQGKRVTVREELPDGTYNLIENVYPPLKRRWGSRTGTWAYLAYVQENNETTYLSNSVKVTVPSPIESSLLLDDFEDANFWTPDYSAGWWDSSNAVYKRSSVNNPVFSGNLSMKVDYDKGNDPWAIFSAYLSADNYRKVNFSNYDVVTLWVNGKADMLLKLRDSSGQEEDVSSQSIDTAGSWKKISFDYSQATSVDLNNIENVLFFLMPGDTYLTGTIFIDEVRLERKRAVLVEDFQDDNFWTPNETVGWWDSNGTVVYKRSRVYTHLASADISRPVMQVSYNKNQDPWALFGAYISTANPLRDFSRHTKLTVWARGLQDAQLLVKLRDRKQQEEDVSAQHVGQGWTKLEFDYSNLNTIDLSDIENILFFIEPGNASSNGTLYLFDISLE